MAQSCWGWQTEEPSDDVLPDLQTASRRFWSHHEAYSIHGLQREQIKSWQCESVVNKKWGYSWENIKPVMICYLSDIFASLILKQPTNRRTNIHSPSSCAAVKAACNPLSSITEQLLLGSHIVPTSATPRVSQLFWPQMSCNTKTQRKRLNRSGANIRMRCCS